MVRRRLLSNSAKQASMSAYQNFWQQQQAHPQSTLVASMPQYWHSMCQQLGGVAPRLAVVAPPEASSRRVSRVRRQLVKAPRETATNYVQQQVPLQRGYQALWDRCCMNQGALLKPGAFLPGFQGAPKTPQQQPHQRSFQYQQGSHLFSYPAAVQMQWQQQHHQPGPVGILKKTSQMETSGLQNPKRVTIRSPTMVRRRFQAPSVDPVKPPKPEVPPKPKKTRQHLLKRHQLLCQKELQRQQQIQKDLHKQLEHQKELQKQREAQKELQKRQKLIEQQQLQKDLQRQREQRQEELQKQQMELLKKQELQKELLKKQELQKELLRKQELQRELLKKQEHQKQLQKQQELQKKHQLELEKMQQQLQQRKLKQQQLGKAQEQQELLEKSKNFNFGKYASSFLKHCRTEILPKPQSSQRNHNFSYEGAPEKVEDPENPQRQGNPYQPRFQPLDLSSKSSTVTLTTDQSMYDFEPPKTPYQSHTTLTDKATNTQIDPLGELLKQGPQGALSKGSRKLNINELLRSEEIKGLNADPMWHSLMQLVAQMCEAKEQENQADKSRLRAGSGADEGRQKQYSVYLMVSSDEDEDESVSSPNTEVESSRMTSDERIPRADEFSKRCGHVYQEEQPRLGRRKRSRKRLNPRLADLAYPFSSPPSLLPMRRPLHWPKPDLSKPSQGRSNRSRTPSRVRSRTSSKHIAQVLTQSSLSSVLDPKRSWRLWEDLPMTARTLNKAYSRMLARSD